MNRRPQPTLRTRLKDAVITAALVTGAVGAVASQWQPSTGSLVIVPPPPADQWAPHPIQH